MDDEFIVNDDTEEEVPEPEPDQQDLLDRQRMKKVARVRRAAYRTQSYTIVGMIGCGVCAGELGRRILVHVVRYGEVVWYHAIYGGLILLTLWWTRGLYRRLRCLQAETAQLRMPDPPTPPSFEGLSDGTQHAENIERMQ